ncbi:MAG: phytase [Candidatus Marinimicrobia bacterium]|nr:phytase [Candidatus Neomarinimicrobiota bacterium]
MNMNKSVFWMCLILLILQGCQKKVEYQIDDEVLQVQATVETTPVPGSDDAADDPCIWIHPTNPSLSTIIGTYKKENGGLLIYDLEGKEIQFVQDGRMNNVDIRYNFPLNGQNVSLVTAGNRRDNTISIYKVDPDSRQLENVAARVLPLGLKEVYGSCMYYSVKTGQYYAFVNDKTGRIEQWHLFDNGRGKVDGKLVRTLFVDSQPEGCVADDILAEFYIGEEEAAIWKFGAEPDDSNEKTLVDSVGNHFVPDVEGLTIYYTNDTTGYLIASSQGNNTYVVYMREGKNDYVGTFQIIDSNSVDGVQDTDGIDVCNFGLGPAFPNGVFVVQDGYNPGAYQNFKLVRWEEIANVFHPPLAVNPEWNPSTLNHGGQAHTE